MPSTCPPDGLDRSVLREAQTALEELNVPRELSVDRTVEALSRLRDSLRSVVDELDSTIEAARVQATNVAESDPVGVGPFTPAQTRVLRSLSLGGTRREIALRLHVSPDTVKTHLRAIYRALGVADRADAIAVARARELL